MAGVSWEVDPEPADADERAALLAAVDEVLAAEGESAWWRSGLEDLGGGPLAQEAWGESRVVES